MNWIRVALTVFAGGRRIADRLALHGRLALQAI
jgi:hypothetical protein